MLLLSFIEEEEEDDFDEDDDDDDENENENDVRWNGEICVRFGKRRGTIFGGGFFDDLIRARIGRDSMPAKSYASESSEEEEEEESSSSSSGGRERGCDVGVFFFIIFFFFTAGRTVERFSIRVAPDDRVRVSSEGERCFGRLRVRAKDDAESIDVSQSRRRKKRL